MRPLLFALIVIFSVPAFAQEPERARQVAHTMGADRIAAGERVTSDAAVAGDLILAGGRVRVLGPAAGDVLVAGGELRVDAAAGQDLYAAGGRLEIDAPVGRNARLAGGEVTLGRRARVAGNATVAGGEVELLGAVDGHLAVAGGRIFIDGAVGGDVEASGGEVALGPNARIAGELHYRSREELERSPGSEVRGTVVREPMPAWDEGARAGARVAVMALAVWTFGLMILAALVAALPRFSARLEDSARARPGMNILVGFAVLVATPFVAALALATGVGVPLGLLLLAGYVVALLLGYVGAGAVLGRTALRRLGRERVERGAWRAFAAALAVLVITLLGAVPLIGWLAVLAAWLLGIGALLLQLRRPDHPAAA